MRAKSHDIQWPVTAKTVENINTNFDTLFESLNAFERTVVSSKGLHEILSAVHSDSVTANRIRGDILTAQGTNPKWTRLAKGTTGLVLTMGANDPAWAAHNVLSATHGDTLAGTVVRGDVVIGNATPKWSRLAKGTSGFVLTAGASDVSWATPAHALLSTTHTDALAATVVRGDVLIGNATPAWSRLAKGTTTYVLTAGATDVSWAVIPTQTSALLSAVHTDTTPAAVVRGDLVIGSGASPTWSRLAAGTAGYLLTMGANEPAWSAPSAVGHVMLSATHTDSTPAAAVRGDLISAQGVSPVWARLAAGTTGYFLKMGANEPAWSAHGLTYSDVGAAPADHSILSATHGDSTAAVVVRGDLIVGIGASPKWERLTKGTSGYFLKATADDAVWAAHGLTYSDVGALAAGGTAVDSDKLDGQHGSYYAIAGAAPAAHQLDGALHTVSGLTTGHFLKATGATTFAFGAHGLAYGDVGAAAASHVHAWTDITSGVPTTWTPIAHDILSAYHGDTTTAAVQRGDLIAGIGSTPKWERLAKGGATTYLKSDGTDLAWAAIAWADVSKTGSSLADLATRAVANLSDGSNVALLNAANTFIGGVQTIVSTEPTLILKRSNSPTDPFSSILFRTSDDTTKWQIATNQAIGPGFEINEGLYSNNRFYISPGGAVNIAQSLTVQGYTTLLDRVIIQGSTGTIWMRRTIADGNSAATIQFQASTGAVLWNIGSQQMIAGSNFEINEGDNAYSRFCILIGGTVGLGFTAAAAKLAINGGVHVGGESDPGDNNLLVDGGVQISALGAFVAADKYVVVDATGNLHVSTLGPLA